MKLQLTNNTLQLPELLVTEYHLQNVVEVELQRDGFFVRSPRKPRAGWKESFQEVEYCDQWTW